MLFLVNNKIFKKPLHSFNKEGTFDITKRLRKKIYARTFNLKKNLDLVRTYVINWYELISNYFHLLEQEQFDEN